MKPTTETILGTGEPISAVATANLTTAGLRLDVRNHGEHVLIRRIADSKVVAEYWPSTCNYKGWSDERAGYVNGFDKAAQEAIVDAAAFQKKHPAPAVMTRGGPSSSADEPVPLRPAAPVVTTLELVRLALAGGAWRLDMNVPATRLVAEMEALRDLLRTPLLPPPPGVPDVLRENPQPPPG